MPEIASAFMKPRFGNEATSTPGTRVGADKVLQSFETLTVSPKIPRTAVKSVGTLAASGVYGAKEHSEWQGEGVLAYNDIAFLLASALCVPSSTTVTAGVAELTYRPLRDNPNTIQTFSIEGGSAAGGKHRVAGAYVNDLSFNFSRNECKFSVSGMGGQMQEGMDLTANPSNVAQVSVEPDSINIYVADTLAGLSQPAAKLKRCISASWSMSGRQTPIFTLDTDTPTFSATVERKDTTFDASITVEQDSQGVEMLNRLRNKGIFFVRFEATGRDIVANQPYKITHTFPCFVSETNRADTDDIYTGEYQLTCCNVDNAFGAGLHGFLETKIRVSSTVGTSVTTATATTAPTANFNKAGVMEAQTQTP